MFDVLILFYIYQCYFYIFFFRTVYLSLFWIDDVPMLYFKNIIHLTTSATCATGRVTTLCRSIFVNDITYKPFPVLCPMQVTHLWVLIPDIRCPSMQTATRPRTARQRTHAAIRPAPTSKAPRPTGSHKIRVTACRHLNKTNFRFHPKMTGTWLFYLMQRRGYCVICTKRTK